jgi:hypothetical protein
MAENATTWTEVCENVGFADGLYRRCRDNVDGFTGFQGGQFDELEDDEPEFGEMLAESALKAPPPPSADWKPSGNFLGDIPWGTVVAYGSVAALAWWFMRPQSQTVVTTETPAVAADVTTPKAA